MSAVASWCELWLSLLMRLVQPMADVVRWSEPWDYEDDDPFVERYGSRAGGQATSLWG